MTYAYDEMYLNDAMNNLGEAVEYAVIGCKHTLKQFQDMFLETGYADEFGRGNSRYISGMAGTELVMDMNHKTGFVIEVEPLRIMEATPEFWTGWALAYYQWKSGRSFENIFNYVSLEEIYSMYSPLHEASEEYFVDVMDELISMRGKKNRLSIQRKNIDMTQKELAERAGVNLRTLQQYEIGSKDLSKASYATVCALAKALYCKPEQLF